MSKDTPRLGRGLNAIVGRHSGLAPDQSIGVDNPDNVRQVALDCITPNPRQPRRSFDDAAMDELARSIRAKGMLQPIIVRPIGAGRFELVAGERRLRAAKLAAMQVVPAFVRSLSDAESLEIAMIENLQREDLSPLERAAGYQRYIDTFNVSIEELAKRLSESRATISNYLRLLRLRPEVHALIGAGQLGMGQARAIAGIADQERQLAVARLAARRNLSVRQVEALARRDGPPPRPQAAPARTADHHYKDVAAALSKQLGLRVSLWPGKKKNSGRIVIHYNELEEFDRVAERIGGRAVLE